MGFRENLDKWAEATRRNNDPAYIAAKEAQKQQEVNRIIAENREKAKEVIRRLGIASMMDQAVAAVCATYGPPAGPYYDEMYEEVLIDGNVLFGFRETKCNGLDTTFLKRGVVGGRYTYFASHFDKDLLKITSSGYVTVTLWQFEARARLNTGDFEFISHLSHKGKYYGEFDIIQKDFERPINQLSEEELSKFILSTLPDKS
ncbi:MAG: hypothetical protein V1808_02340 [Candidatus Daviesbacteria bacterium]